MKTPRKSKFRPFVEAREFARSLNLNSNIEWTDYCKGESKPSDIPSNPRVKFPTEWAGWGDWLGNGKDRIKYRTFEEARAFVKGLHLEKHSDWVLYAKGFKKPIDIPIRPEAVYKSSWIDWNDWLGNGKQKTSYLPFAEAKQFTKDLKLISGSKWRAWAKTSERPNNIPLSPERVYKTQWNGWDDWLGTDRKPPKMPYLAFELAREFARSLNFKQYSEWEDYCRGGKKPLNIPATPSTTYKAHWKSSADWLGNGKDSDYLSFEDARDFARGLNLRSTQDWQEYCDGGNKPKNIPSYPREVYDNWVGMSDWLGTGKRVPIAIPEDFFAAREFARGLKLKTVEEWRVYAAGELKPANIPSSPSGTYKQEWISWGDWLGSYSSWTKNALIGFIKSLYPILPNLDPSELYLILRNNNCLNAIEQLGDDSPLKRLINDTLHGDVDELAKTFAEINKLQILKDDSEILESSPSDEQEITAEIIPTEQDNGELPKLSSTQILDNLDHVENVLGISDEETVQFLVNKGLGRLWGQVLGSASPDDEIEVIRAHTGATYSTQVRDKYLEQYAGASSLPIPADYAFKKNGELIKPNLMQRLVAYRLLKEHRLGNWSGTGAGKTLGAILASRVVDAKVTIIIGLNSTIWDERSGWAVEIKNAFPDSNVLIKVKSNVVFSATQPNYLLLNYETFQQADSKAVVDEILDNHQIDLIVLDEVHSAKSKNQEESKKRKLINHLLLEASKRNPDLHVLGMSATPVVNSLDEAVSLIEMIKGREYNELDTTPKLSNALAIHAQLVINGIRYVPNYAMELKETPIEIVDNAIASELQSIGKGQVLQIEIALLRAKLNTIIELCKPGTVIYSLFVEEIFDMISSAVKASGLRVARFNGDDKTGLELFKQGKVDVLIGSSALGTGVDGLQYVCNRLIIVCLPWTSAGYEQLLGRIYRQGSKFTEVEVFIPQVTLMNNGDTWSWDKQREARIKYKKTLADAAVDGVVPEANLASTSLMLAEAKKALNEWVTRLESGDVYELSRRELKVPLPADDIKKGLHKYGDFSAMNQRFNTSKSTTMHDRLVADPEEFYLYHSLYREARESWSEVPYQVLAEQLNKRPDWVIGDFGCGEALLSKSLRNKVYSFDHVAINPSVIACDMAKTGLDAEMLDVAVFSLSLMGVNWQDYLMEAHRLLRSGGLLKVSEPASSWAEHNYASLKQGIESAGFVLNGEPRLSSKFIYLDAIKPL
jgi:superfamily II DNA or RNA helicase